MDCCDKMMWMLQVVHLATVEDDSVARVLSWHMADDMDCIVTRTSKKVLS